MLVYLSVYLMCLVRLMKLIYSEAIKHYLYFLRLVGLNSAGGAVAVLRAAEVAVPKLRIYHKVYQS